MQNIKQHLIFQFLDIHVILSSHILKISPYESTSDENLKKLQKAKISTKIIVKRIIFNANKS